jgi:hypothetical protein
VAKSTTSTDNDNFCQPVVIDKVLSLLLLLLEEEKEKKGMGGF